jgi:lipopolysaccharide export system protein LptA
MKTDGNMTVVQRSGGLRRLFAAVAVASALLVPAQTNSAGAAAEVQIEADQMQVNQQARQATFTGNVDAVQGNVRMRSDNLVVDYDEAPSGEGKKTDVRYLSARGNVVVTSKGQTVTAQWAKFDVRANTVEFGDNVTVTEGRTVLHGRRLVLDLTTGESRLVGGGERVQGTFFRND